MGLCWRRVQSAGAQLDDSVGPLTQYIIAAKDIKPVEIAEKIDLDSEKEKWPEGKYLVEPRFVNGCIAAKKVIDHSK